MNIKGNYVINKIFNFTTLYWVGSFDNTKVFDQGLSRYYYLKTKLRPSRIFGIMLII